MGFSISKAHDLMVEGLNARALRQKLISSNIANIDTPFYKARDIDFESALASKAKKVFNEDNNKKLPLAKTDKAHLDPVDIDDPKKPTLFFRDGHMARNDANTVDLDIETTEMSKNAVMFNALSAALKKDSTLFKYVLDSSAKV